MVALSVCVSVMCGVLPCRVASAPATVCESLGSFKSNVNALVIATVSLGLKSQLADCVVSGTRVLSALETQSAVTAARLSQGAALKGGTIRDEPGPRGIANSIALKPLLPKQTDDPPALT